MSLDSEPERTGPAARRDTIRGILFDLASETAREIQTLERLH